MPEVLFIGTGDAFGSGGRRNSAILLRDYGRTLLLDCGPTTLVGLKALGIDPLEIDAIAVSHFHGDHAAGVPFLLLDYRYGTPRSRPLQILGPPGIQERVELITRAYCYDDESPYALRFGEFVVGSALQLDGFKITPFAAYHHPETRPHMLRVETGGRSVFFSGDTGWHDELPQTVAEVDLFISEATEFSEGFEYHLSHERLQKERARFRCHEMILTHLGRDALDNLDRFEFKVARDGLELRL